MEDSQKECIECPHCERALTEAEIRSILGRFARAKRLSTVGASRFAKMTPEERSAEARKAAQARWDQAKKAPRTLSAFTESAGTRSDAAVKHNGK